MNQLQWIGCNPSGFIPSSFMTRNKRNWNIKRPNNINWKKSTLKELHKHNQLKVRRHVSKKKFSHVSKSEPFAPRNTTSFIIRSKKSGGITSVITPSPVTPAILPTPVFSPYKEVLVDVAKEEWGVDGYGSMKGLIRVRCCGNDEVQEGFDHGLSRFEMVYPSYGVVDYNNCVLENRVDDHGTHIAQLEEENLMLKDRLVVMEREFDKLRARLQSLETRRQGLEEGVVENEESCDVGEKNVHGMEVLEGVGVGVGVGVGRLADVHMEDSVRVEENIDCVIEDAHVL